MLRNSILKHGNTDLIKALLEVTANTLKGNLKLHNRQKSKLEKYKNILRRISGRKENLETKRKILIQRGGFLPLLLSTLFSTVIGKLIS